MREFAKISPQIWISEQGRKIKKLGMEAQLVSIYLLTNPHANMIGVYYLPVAFIAHELGLCTKTVSDLLTHLCELDYCSYDFESEYIWVHEMGITQISGELKPRDNRVKAVNEAFMTLPYLPYLQKFYNKYADIFLLDAHSALAAPFEGALKPLRSKEKEKENDKEKKKEKEITRSCDGVAAETEKYLSKANEQEVYYNQAIEVLLFLNTIARKAYEPTESNLLHILERLQQGETVDVCRSVIVKKSRQWLNDKKMDPNLNSVTLFKKENYYRYKGELVLPKEGDANESK